jgi:hypothetical protein
LNGELSNAYVFASSILTRRDRFTRDGLRERKEEEFDAIRNTQFVEDFQEIVLDCVPAQSQAGSNLAIGEALCQMIEHSNEAVAVIS